jgi:hypothetical protein
MATDQSPGQNAQSAFVEANRIHVSMMQPSPSGDVLQHQHDHSTANAQDQGGQQSTNKGGKPGEKGTKRARSVTGTVSLFFFSFSMPHNYELVYSRISHRLAAERAFFIM